MKSIRGAALAIMLSAVALASDPEYDKRVTAALNQKTDAWGESLIQKGGATYENIKDFLKPLFYSTGTTRDALDVHNVLFGLDGGEPPWVVPVADGSRIYGNNYRSIHFLQVSVGPEGSEPYGGALDRLRGPFLDQGYYPILQTEYRDRDGNVYTQESLAAVIPELPDVVAMVKLGVKPSGTGAAPKIRVALAEYDMERQGNRLVNGRKTFIVFNGSPHAGWDHNNIQLTWDGAQTVYAMWLPHPAQLGDFTIDAARYERAKADWRAYWDKRLNKGTRIRIPEPMAANALKNAIIQNLILRHRYSLGAAVYHTDWYPRESCDSLTALGLLGYTGEFAEGLNYMLGKPWREREFGSMATWGEYMAHAARYYFLTRDAAFIRRNSPLYEQYARTIEEQIASDPNGLVHKTNRTADIGALGYWTNEQAVCWRGLRDMAEVWRLAGRADLHQRFAPVAARFRKSLLKAVDASKARMPDGSSRSLHPTAGGRKALRSHHGDARRQLLEPDLSVLPWGRAFGKPTARIWTAWWRTCGTTARCFWACCVSSSIPGRRTGFNRAGMPGYFTSGYDNVYLTGYLEALADRDDAEHLVLGFYGKLAHGMTRNTFSEGEGSTVAPIPPEIENALGQHEQRLIVESASRSAGAMGYRSTMATPNSTNNAVYLETLRLMLVREGFNDATGLPETLDLAHATPRGWLEDGKEIEVAGMPTWFGPVGYHIRSNVGGKRVTATVGVPARETARTLKLKLRTPGQLAMQSVVVNGKPWTRFDAAAETIDLTGAKGTVNIEVQYR